jgi:hypothetical protein
MTDQELIRTMANLRWAQKWYFKTPKDDAHKADKQRFLRVSKALEKAVDDDLKARGFSTDRE